MTDKVDGEDSYLVTIELTGAELRELLKSPTEISQAKIDHLLGLLRYAKVRAAGEAD